MRFPKLLTFLCVLIAGSAFAGTSAIDMDDPRRALGRENDIRIDAQLVRETVSPGMPIGVTYQIQNLTKAPIAVADKLASTSYDVDTQTITFAIGSETPQDSMPHMTTVAPGETKVFRTAATAMLSPAATRAKSAAVPRFVQLKVSILRDLAPFDKLIASQARGPQRIPDELFDKWFECNDTILLNSVPIHFTPRANPVSAESARGSF